MQLFKKKAPASQTAGLLIALSILIAVGFLVLFLKTEFDRDLLRSDIAFLSAQRAEKTLIGKAQPAVPTAAKVETKGQRLWFAGLSFEYDADGAELTATDKSLRIEHPMTDALEIEKIDKSKIPNGLVDTGVPNVGALLKDCGDLKCVQATYFLGKQGTYKISLEADVINETGNIYPWLKSMNLHEKPAFADTLTDEPPMAQ